MWEFHADKAPTKIQSSPARTSKSYSGAHDALADPDPYRGLGILEPGLNPFRGLAANLAALERGEQVKQHAESQTCWVVAPNYDLAKEFDYLWDVLVSRQRYIQWPFKVRRKANQPKQGNMFIELLWGTNAIGQEVTTLIEVKSATNEQSLQSEEVHVCILSEAARLAPKVWYKYLSTRCGRSIWPTTPDIQAYHIWEMIESGKASPELGISNYHFTPRANPKYNWGRFWSEHMKAESRTVGAILTHPLDANSPCSQGNGHDCFDENVHCDAAKDDGFAEQFLGQWVFHKGRVVPIREREGSNGEPAHVVSRDPDWLHFAKWVVACDYGFHDPAVGGIWAVGPEGHALLRRCVYQAGLTSDEFVARIQAEWDYIMAHCGVRTTRADLYLGDPKKPEVEKGFRNRGLPIWNLNKKVQASRMASHRALMDLLSIDVKIGMPYLTVHSDCTEVINEWRMLRWSERVRTEDAPTAVEGQDHAYDMARYFAAANVSPPEKRHAGYDTFHLAKMQVAREKSRIRRTVPVTSQSYIWSQHGAA